MERAAVAGRTKVEAAKVKVEKVKVKAAAAKEKVVSMTWISWAAKIPGEVPAAMAAGEVTPGVGAADGAANRGEVLEATG